MHSPFPEPGPTLSSLGIGAKLFTKLNTGGLFPEKTHRALQVAPGRGGYFGVRDSRRRFAPEQGGGLGEDEGVSHGAPGYHYAGAAGLREHGEGGRGAEDVAGAEDWHAAAFQRPGQGAYC